MPARLPRRGRLITSDGVAHDVPEHMLDREVLSWPFGMPEKKPGAPTKILSLGELFERHEVVKDSAYIWTRADSPRDATEKEIQALLRPNSGEAQASPDA